MSVENFSADAEYAEDGTFYVHIHAAREKVPPYIVGRVVVDSIECIKRERPDLVYPPARVHLVFDDGSVLSVRFEGPLVVADEIIAPGGGEHGIN